MAALSRRPWLHRSWSCSLILWNSLLNLPGLPCSKAFAPRYISATLPRRCNEFSRLVTFSENNSNYLERSRASPNKLKRRKSPHQSNHRKRNQRKNDFPLNQELKSLSRKRHSDAAIWAHELLEQALMDPMSDNGRQVDEISFNTVIMGFAKQSERGNETAPDKAEALLRRMDELSATNGRVTPSIFTYNAVIETWKKSGLLRAQHEVMRLFEEVKSHRTIEPNTYTYNLVLSAYAFDNSPDTNAQEALEQMDRIREEMQDSGIQPDRRTISVLLAAYARHGHALKAQQILEDSWRRYRNGQRDLQPNQVWINCAINAWAQSKLPEAGDRADSLLSEMQSFYELGQLSVRPDTTTFNSCMNCHAETGNATRVQELLTELEHRYALTGEAELEPDTITYSTVIKSYANSNDKDEDRFDVAVRALTVLNRMEQLHAAGRKKMAPNLVTFNTVIHIWAQMATRESLSQATQLLKRLHRHKYIKPDATSYAELILGWSRSGLRDAGYRAEQLLGLMERLPQSRKHGLNLTVMYNAVIHAWAKSLDHRAAPIHVDNLLERLSQIFLSGNGTACPDTTTFLSVSDTYAKSRVRDAQERCDALIARMDELVEAGAPNISKNRNFWNSILNALAKSEQVGVVNKAEEIVVQMDASDEEESRPDIVTYAALISCYTKSGESPDRAEELLEFVEDQYDKGVERLQPNAVFYSSVQQAWSKNAETRDGADKAERLLRRNELLWKEGRDHCKPHAIVYNAVMDAIARSSKHGDACCGRRAEALLLEMEDMYKAGYEHLKPSRRSFAAVMLAYRLDGDANKAEELLHRMETLTKDEVYDVHPCVVDYNCAIGALADSAYPDAAERAQALLDRMYELYRDGDLSTRPDEITYSGVIKAWLKRQDEKGSAMARAMLQKFLELVEECKSQAGAPLRTQTVYNVLHTYRRRRGGEEPQEEKTMNMFDAVPSELDDIDWNTV